MMSSRALSLAAVTLLVGCCAMGRVEAQENLDAGKSPSQIFTQTCTACHKSPRGLLKTVAPGSLQGFLRQHYTTGPEMAGVLASYLMSNGATDTRYGEKKGAKGGKETRSEAPAARPEAGAEGQPAATEHGPEGRKAKRRLSKRAKPEAQEETAPKGADNTAERSVEPARADTAKVEPAKPEPAKSEEAPRSPETAKPVEHAKPVESTAQSVTADPPKAKVNEALPPSLRPDPVPPVTPAQPANSPVPPLSH